MLRLDVGTLAFSAAVVSLAAALVIALSAALHGLAALPIILKGSIPAAVIVLGVNPMIVLAALAFHAGACLLTGRVLPVVLYGTIFIAFSVGLTYFQAFEESLNTRIALGSLVRAPIFFHAAFLLHAASAGRMPSGGAAMGMRLVMGVALGWAVLLALRGLGAVAVENPIYDLAPLEGMQAFYFLATGLSHALVVIGLLRMDTDVMATRSESDLRAILDNMTDIFYRTDAQGRLLMLSHSVETVLGYSVDELLGRLATDIYVNPLDRIPLLEAMEAKGGSVTDYELQVRHKNGIALWLSISCRMRLDELGRRVGTEGVLRLIEERKRAEVNIQESRSMIRALLDASADAIMLIEPDGKILAVNGVTAGRFGHTAEELSGTSLWDLFPPEVAAARSKACQAVLDSGEPVHTLDRRGDRYLDNSIYPVTGRDGTAVRLAIYSRDITVQKLAEARIADYVAEMERSNAELEQFAYVASHDLREPLRMISSYLQLLERRYGSQLGADGAEFLSYARDGAQRMDRLVLDLLELSRIGRRGAAFAALPALPAIQLAIRHLQPAITECGAQVTVRQTEPLPMIMGDTDQITRLFQNLIGNALKYRADDRQAEITVWWEPSGGGWTFHVKDNGIGIEPEYYEKIFRIFQRLHTRDKYEGTGIGLAICKKIVERHEGRIWVDSTLGEGSTFSFTLKAA